MTRQALLQPILLFLDFDGVLIPHPRDENDLPYIEPAQYLERCDWSLVSRLAATLAPYVPDLRIIVSSSWRLFYPLSALRAALDPLVLTDTTGRSEHSRYEEIRAYMYKRPEQWLALDDDVRHWPQAERWRLVLCDPYVGINDEGRLLELSRKIETLRQPAEDA